MTDPTPTPAPPVVPSTPDATTQEKLITLFQSISVLLGLVGVNIPPIFTNLVFEQQVASIIMIVIPLALAAYHRVVTSPAKADAAARASVKLNRAVRLA